MKIVLSEIYNFDYLHKHFFYTTFSFSKQELTFMIPNQLIPPATAASSTPAMFVCLFKTERHIDTSLNFSCI